MDWLINGIMLGIGLVVGVWLIRSGILEVVLGVAALLVFLGITVAGLVWFKRQEYAWVGGVAILVWMLGMVARGLLRLDRRERGRQLKRLAIGLSGVIAGGLLLAWGFARLLG